MSEARGIKQVGHFDCAGGGQVTVERGIAYIGHIDSPHGTTIADVSDPKKPRRIAELAMPPGFHSHKVRVGNGIMVINRERTGPESSETLKIIDFDFNHHFVWGDRQDIVWGAGYRHFWDQDAGTIDQSFNPPNASLELFAFFGQDTITLHPDRLFFTFGAKFENSYFTTWGIEPSVRLAWTPSNWVTFWSAVSRAERSPARRDTQLVAPLAVFPDPNGSSTPVEVILFGSPKFMPEHVLAYEAGFRSQPNGRLSIDVSTFFNRYDHLESLEPGPEILEPSPPPARFVIPITFGNLMYGTTEGGEISANLKLTDRWTLSSGYAYLGMHLHTKPESVDTMSVAENQGSSPQHQAQLRSHMDLSHGLSWDASAYFISALVLAWPDDHVEYFEGRVDGRLVLPPRGANGFGYDPIFLPDGHTRGFGEMSAEEKHGIPADGSLALSHRARAFQMLARACLG